MSPPGPAGRGERWGGGRGNRAGQGRIARTFRNGTLTPRAEGPPKLAVPRGKGDPGRVIWEESAPTFPSSTGAGPTPLSSDDFPADFTLSGPSTHPRLSSGPRLGA